MDANEHVSIYVGLDPDWAGLGPLLNRLMTKASSTSIGSTIVEEIIKVIRALC